jgi:arylsulfatase A-like enzyme
MTVEQRSRSDAAVPRTFTLVLWFALATGLAQYAVWLVARYVIDRAVFIDRHVIWAAPLAAMLVFTITALLLAVLGRIAPALNSPRVRLGVFTAVAGMTVLLMVPRVHVLALLVLAAGAGVQVGRWLAARPAFAYRIVRATTLPMLVLVAVATTATIATEQLRERRAAQALPETAAGLPNVLLIIWDTVRAASLSLYGYERPTSPFLENFAQRGVVFDGAISTAPWTLASHGSFFTGHYPFDLTAGWDIPLDGRHPTLAEELASHGYATGAFVANHIFSPPEFGLARGFVHYEGRPITIGSVLGTSTLIDRLHRLYNRTFETHYVPEERTADDITSSFLRWRRQQIGTRPYFAFLNYFDAHEPYTPPAPFDEQFGRPRVRQVINNRRPTDEELRDARDAYDGAIAYLDAELKQLLGELERRGELDDTLVIITSDHGEHLGEHGLLDHGNTLYSPLLRVPLVLTMPARIPAGLRVEEAISLRNLPSTILDLLGIEPRRPFPGYPLARSWQSAPGAGTARADTVLAQVPFAPGQPEWYPLAAGDMRSVLLWPHQLIVDGKGREEVYDLERDPAALHNVANQVDPAVLTRLRGALAEYPARARVGGD